MKRFPIQRARDVGSVICLLMELYMITFTSTNNVGSGVSGPKLSAIFPFLMRSRLENLLFRLWILLGRFLLTNRRCLKKNYCLLSRYSYLLDLSLASRTPILLVGPTGTGKSLCIQEKMSGFSEEEFASLCLTFTAQTSAAQVQVILQPNLFVLPYMTVN